MEADVVSLTFLGNLFENVVAWEEIVFHHIVLFLFLRDADPFNIWCHGHAFGHFNKEYHKWLLAVRLGNE